MVAPSPLWVGIDVASRSLDISLGSKGETLQVTNDASGIKALLKKLRRLKMHGIICEATGSYHHDLAWALWDAGLPLTIVNPAWVKSFRGHAGKHAKTDRADARLLAEYGEYHQPIPSRVPSQEERVLKSLLSARTDLVQERVATRNRLRAAKEPVVQQALQRIMTALEQESDRLETEMEAIIATSPELTERRNLLRTMPGVGRIISITLLVFLPELGTLNRREIAALAGLAPIANDSGTMSGKRWVQRGRGTVRREMYMAAWTFGHNDALRSRKHRLMARGKPKKVVLIALARWMLTMLNVMVRDQLTWQQLDQSHRPVEMPMT